MRRTRSFRGMILAAACLAVAAPAIAAPAEKKPEPSAKKPAAKAPAKTPAKAAASSSAKASAKTETKAAPKKVAAPVAKGDVTRAQVIKQTKQIFGVADANKDGFIDQAEFRVRMTAILNRTPPGTPGAPTKEQAQQKLNAAAAAFRELDTDGDGKLSLTESTKRPLDAFELADANHDGVVTMAEKMALRREVSTTAAGPRPKLEPGR